MNTVNLTGRLVKDPEMRQAGETAITRFTIAIDRPPMKDGTKQTDFPSCVAFGKRAETIAKYFAKGHMIGVTGRLQTGSYEKNGQKVFTTDVVVDNIDFLTPKGSSQEQPKADPVPQGFSELADDIPF